MVLGISYFLSEKIPNIHDPKIYPGNKTISTIVNRLRLSLTSFSITGLTLTPITPMSLRLGRRKQDIAKYTSETPIAAKKNKYLENQP